MPARRAAALGLAAALAVGCLLRAWNLPAQVMADDELHLVRVILRGSVGEALTTYRLADTSLPLTGLFRALFLAGVPLSEMAFRLPALLAGLAALCALPLAFARRLPVACLVALAWLVATWPSLVLYSRIARPYMPMVLAAGVALAAFESWWRTGRPRMAALYATSAVLAAWLHPLALPAALAPLLFGSAALLRAPSGARRRPLVLVGLATASGLALFLVPAWPSLVALLEVKRTDPEVAAATLGEAALLLAGTREPLVALAVGVATAAGAALLWRRSRRFGALAATVVVAQAAGVALLGPEGADHPVVLHRYLLPALPVTLLWLALAIAACWGDGARPRPATLVARRAVALALAAAPLLTGPFADPAWWRSSFAHHAHYVRYSRPPMAVASLPAVYDRLPPGPLLEAPFHPEWELSRSPYAYQRVHGRPVAVVTLFQHPHRRPLRFRNAVPAIPDAILATPAAALLVHLRPERLADAEHPPPVWRRAQRRRHVETARAFVAELTAAWGPADWRAERILAWDLARVRRTRAAP